MTNGGFRPSLKTTTLPGGYSPIEASAVGLRRKAVTIDYNHTAVPSADANGDIILPAGTLIGELSSPGANAAPHAPCLKTGETNEVQTITVDGTGGTYDLTLPAEAGGTEITGISATATAAALQALIENEAGVDVGDVAVTGGPGDSGGTTPYVVTWKGQFAGKSMGNMTIDDTNVTGGGATATFATTTQGSATSITDGTDTAIGVLAHEVNLRDGDVVAYVYNAGAIYEAACGYIDDSGTLTAIDAAGKADLPFIQWT